MPQRFLRPGITNSERWNSVSFEAQSLFIRMLTLVDDFGRYDARAMLLRSHAFPVSPDITAAHVTCMCDELSEVELITIYEVNGREYLQINRWQERARCASKFPDPPNSEPGSQPRGLIYFVHAKKANRIKIGFTEWRVENRVARLQTGSPEVLELIGSMHGTRKEERDLHRRFAAINTGGEWFSSDESLITFANNCSQMLRAENICLLPSPSPSAIASTSSPVHPRPSTIAIDQPTGAAASPPLSDLEKRAEKERQKRLPTTDIAIRISQIFRRRLTTAWDEKEIKAFKALGVLDLEEFALVEEFYTKSGSEYLRRDLCTFLNNYSGELDRARDWKTNPAKNGTKHRTEADRDRERTGITDSSVGQNLRNLATGQLIE